MLLESTYDLGQMVYLKTDKDQHERMIIGITFRPTGVLYEASPGGWYYEMELTTEKNVLATTTN